MIDGLNIREYAVQDKDALIIIMRLNIPQYFDESEMKDFEHYLEMGMDRYFVMEVDGKIIGGGGIGFSDNHDTGFLSWNFLKPTFHGQGWGKKLLEYRMNLIYATDKVEKIVVGTSQHTYRFYEKNGFAIREIHKDYWSEGFDLYDMVHDKN